MPESDNKKESEEPVPESDNKKKSEESVNDSSLFVVFLTSKEGRLSSEVVVHYLYTNRQLSDFQVKTHIVKESE